MKRYRYIDVIRGSAVIYMVLFHLVYSLILYGMVPEWLLENPIIAVVQPIGASVFLIVSGISSGFSKSNIKRGIKILLCAALVTLGTFLFDNTFYVKFGILHFIGSATLLVGLVPQIKKIKINPIWFLAAFAAWLLWMPTHYPVSGLAWLGFPSAGFASSDYFPMLPWIFPYIAGVLLTKVVDRAPVLVQKWKCKPVEWLGKHALLIYLLHQPIIVGLLELYHGIVG